MKPFKLPCRRRFSARQLLVVILLSGTALFSLRFFYVVNGVQEEAQADSGSSKFTLETELRHLEPVHDVSLETGGAHQKTGGIQQPETSTKTGVVPPPAPAELSRDKSTTETRESLPAVKPAVNEDISAILAKSYDIMKERAFHLRQGCTELEESRDEQPPKKKMLSSISSKTATYGRIEIGTDTAKKYLYCPIMKVGSTFFSRALYSLRHTGNISNPYEIPINTALKEKKPYLKRLLPLTKPSTQEFLSDAVSFLFVREPFVRLLSGYMDKIFAPNPYYWKTIGLPIVIQYRPKTNSTNRGCGHDVTFSEFVQYMVDAERGSSISRHRDPHFIPAYDECKVCHLNYTLVGKMETFSNDVGAIVHELGIDVSKTQLTNWSKEATVDAIMDSVYSPFEWKEKVKKCISWHEAHLRIWRKLQSRGIIPLEDEFPFSEQESDTSVTEETFIAEAVKRNKAADKGRLKLQKKEVLTMAYGNLEPELIQKLTQTFKNDFELFQYNDKPDFLYDKEFVDKYRDAPSLFNVGI